ncbi:MAG: pilin [Candidatus Paceibacterota bacterium]|jgi:uncharacterized membrane protein YidH (DUF202 family)
MKSKLIKITSLAALALPLVASAAISTVWFTDAITSIQNVLDALVPLLIGLAVIVFLWGVVKFVTAAGDEEKRKEGRGFIIWGLVGIAIMIALWSLVGLLTGWTGTGVVAPPTPPLLP